MSEHTGDLLDTAFTRAVGVAYPVICGAMYPCSNPELVAAASQAGGIGILQPISLTYVHGYDFREGVRYIKSLTDRPVGMNALIEQSSQKYRERMQTWIDIALEEGIRLFVTSLGKPDWVARKAHEVGGLVYHDVTERKWAQKGVDCGVDGLIGVNSRAGGHAGPLGPQELLDQVGDLGLPVMCAGGVGTPEDFLRALRMGYAGVQMGTRFIATEECTAKQAYKDAIVRSDEADIVLTERISGVPVAVIDTPSVRRMGLKAGPIARLMLRGGRTKHWIRTFFALKSLWQLKRASQDAGASLEYWGAGRSVAGVHGILPTAEVIQSFAEAAGESEPRVTP
ncbi:MAG: nitronate monooxygenase [Gemmatimonadota bacterium]|nr:MAG: nitronate monooxygenase [Gemmatimonadota bacterium]